jgi:3',5'-cyclic AMP phosphodiesterase CpdA
MKTTIILFIVCICMLFFSAAKANDTLIYFAQSTVTAGSSWKYLDNNTDLTAVAWKDSNYVETAAWKTGNSELGYGDGDENTCVAWNAATVANPNPCGSGVPAGNKFITTYFRKTFYIANPAAYFTYVLQYKRDDGLQIFINGVRYEISNLSDPVTHSTLAANAADDGETIYSINIPPSAFYGSGRRNVIAVDVHQNTATSSDLTFDMQLIGVNSASITRGPYLQIGNETGITFRWRTDLATNSRVTWGTVNGVYPNTVDSATVTTEHTVRVTGLTADTKYFYTIGSTSGVLQGNADNYFVTAPLSASTRKTRVWAIGDCGNASTNQIDTKNAFKLFTGTNYVDAMITIGDNAYSSGLDNEFQVEFFDIYKDDVLKYYKLYPAPGNHDYGNSSANTGVRNNAYYNSFNLPAAGQCGGVPSGTEAYYSFDIGNIHFLSLDSYGRENANTTKLYDTSGAQALWIKADLAANTKPWVVAYFHHPPYTMTSHNSDTESGDLGRIRQEFITILERYGVDMVLCGHSHGYERSYLLSNYTALEPAFNSTVHTATKNTQNAKYDGTGALSCPYTYNLGKYNHGSMYVVSGSAGQLGGTQAAYPHNAMFYSNATNGGSFYFEADSNRLDAKFISYTGTGGTVAPFVRDRFTIFKEVKKRQTINVVQFTPSVLKASWRGGYYWPNNGGVTSQAVTVNNSTVGTFQYIVRDSASNVCIADTFDVVVSFGTLPVIITSFTATLNQNKVVLDWVTSQEINNRHFTLEKSSDGVNFNYLTRVNAVGNSNTSTNYKFIDAAPFNGVNYYRLSQTDIDGMIRYFEVKKVTYKSDKDFYSSIFNTGKNKVNVNITSNKADNVLLQVIDMQGKTVVQNNFAVQNGNTIKELVIIPSGIYIVKLVNLQGVTITKKIIVE